MLNLLNNNLYSEFPLEWKISERSEKRLVITINEFSYTLSIEDGLLILSDGYNKAAKDIEFVQYGRLNSISLMTWIEHFIQDITNFCVYSAIIGNINSGIIPRTLTDKIQKINKSSMSLSNWIKLCDAYYKGNVTKVDIYDCIRSGYVLEYLTIR